MASWIATYGRANIADGEIVHVPWVPPVTAETAASSDATVAASTPPHTIVRSNLEFEQGTISWQGRVSGPKGVSQLILQCADTGGGEAVAQIVTDTGMSLKGNAELFVGLNVLGAPYGFADFRNGKWEGAGGAGLGTELASNEWVSLKLTVRGSNLDLYISGVRVYSVTRTLLKGPIGVFLQGDGPEAVRNVVVFNDAPVCFVVMQFTDEFDALYHDVIEDVCKSYGYEVVRGDDFYTSGQIIEDITRSIRESALIIADVTPDNANVFYEVGYAHALGKPTILLSDRKRERLPFDISGFRTLFYDNTIGGKRVVEERLKQHLDALRPKSVA